MQDIFNIIIVFIVGILAILVKTTRSNNCKRKIAENHFSSELNKPSLCKDGVIQKPVRKVSDITTDMLRDQRRSCEWIKARVIDQEAIDKYKNKLILINIRLSIKQTKP